MKASDHALDIAVDRGGAPIESDGGNSCCSIRANTGQRAEFRHFTWKFAGISLDDGAGAGMQVAGARVISEPLPDLQNLVERGCCQRSNIGPTCHESVEIRADCCHCGLLQHDLAEPHAVRVRSHTGRRPPWQVPAVTVVRGEEGCGIGELRCGQG